MFNPRQNWCIRSSYS